MDLKEIVDILRNAPAAQPVEFRLYYDDSGEPLFYTMEDFPGNYINVSAETYRLAPRNIRIVDGKLTFLDTPRKTRKLYPDPDSGTPCHPKNVCVVVGLDSEHTKWKKR